MQTTSRILQFFCYVSFKDLLALTSFAENLSFLTCVVFKIFAINNALQSKHQFLRNAFITSYL